MSVVRNDTRLYVVQVEYRCLFCPEVFSDEPALYSHTRAHEQHYSAQRGVCSSRASRISAPGSAQTRVVQTAVPDTTCPEDQRSSAVDTAAPAIAVDTESARKSAETEMARMNVEMVERGDVSVKKSVAPFNSRKASILRRLSAGVCYLISVCRVVCL